LIGLLEGASGKYKGGVMEHFNKLSPAEAERLALLAEELGEAIQAIGKILRHGYESRHPKKLDGSNNRDDLTKELGHVCHSIDLMIENTDIRADAVDFFTAQKRHTVKEYLHHHD